MITDDNKTFSPKAIERKQLDTLEKVETRTLTCSFPQDILKLFHGSRAGIKHLEKPLSIPYRKQLSSQVMRLREQLVPVPAGLQAPFPRQGGSEGPASCPLAARIQRQNVISTFWNGDT